MCQAKLAEFFCCLIIYCIPTLFIVFIRNRPGSGAGIGVSVPAPANSLFCGIFNIKPTKVIKDKPLLSYIIEVMVVYQLVR